MLKNENPVVFNPNNYPLLLVTSPTRILYHFSEANPTIKWRDGGPVRDEEPIPLAEFAELLMKFLFDFAASPVVEEDYRGVVQGMADCLPNLFRACEHHPSIAYREEVKQLVTYSAKEAQPQKLKKPDYLFLNFPYKTLGELVGQPKAGKTFFCEEIALMIASGKPTIAPLWVEGVKEPVGLFVAEDDWATVTGWRLHHMKERFDIGDEEASDLTVIPAQELPLVAMDGTRVVPTTHLRHLKKLIGERGWKLVILDSYALHMPVDSMSDTVQTEALRLVNAVMKETGCSILFVDHTRKSDYNGKLDLSSARGSGAKGCTVRWNGYLERKENGEIFFKTDGVNLGQDLSSIRLQRGEHGVLVTPTVEEERRGEEARRKQLEATVLAAVTDKGIACSKLEKLVKQEGAAVLKSLVERGKVCVQPCQGGKRYFRAEGSKKDISCKAAADNVVYLPRLGQRGRR